MHTKHVLLSIGVGVFALLGSVLLSDEHSSLPHGLRPFRPLPLKFVNLIGDGLAALGLLQSIISLDPDELRLKACKAANLTHTSCILDERAKVAASKLSVSLEEDARLTLLGRVVAQGQIVNTLTQRFQLEAKLDEETDEGRTLRDEVEQEVLLPPIVIVGLPRTGTTFLHNLMVRDPQLRGPIHWEVMAPVPPVTGKAELDEPRISEQQHVLEQFKQLAPDLDRYHPLDALNPEECVAIFSQSLVSLQFWMTMNVSSYTQWLLSQDLLPAFRWHKRVLQYFQNAEAKAKGSGHNPRRWVLKTPWYLGTTSEVLHTYPDAQIVHVHRDPRQSLTSVSSLLAKLYGVVSDHVDLKAIGQMNRKLWSKFAGDAMRVRKQQRDSLPDYKQRVVDVQFEDLVENPLDAVRRIYHQLQLQFTPEAEQQMQSFLHQGFGKDKHGKHKYDGADFGFASNFSKTAKWATYTNLSLWT